LREVGLAASGASIAGYLAAGAVAGYLVLGMPSMARADDDAPLPAPRTAITIGGASVVLIATTDKLYAFVDRIEDNTPVEDSEVEIDTSDGDSITMNKAPISMNKATAGMFVGPISRKGHMQDAFMVTLHSSVGDGQEPAEITYTDAIPSPSIMAVQSKGAQLAVALVSGGIGAIATVMIMLWLRGGRKRPAAGRAGGSAQVA
jgi:hypothetical protein